MTARPHRLSGEVKTGVQQLRFLQDGGVTGWLAT